jgi:hypothetical protein
VQATACHRCSLNAKYFHCFQILWLCILHLAETGAVTFLAKCSRDLTSGLGDQYPRVTAETHHYSTNENS